MGSIHVARRLISSGSKFEAEIGYSRAVVVDDEWIFVSGTTGFDYTRMEIKSGVVAQCERALQNIDAALEQAGASLSDVIRTRILLTRIGDWEQVGLVHGEFFGTIRPANTVMQVTGFIDPEWLVEIEADAVIEE